MLLLVLVVVVISAVAALRVTASSDRTAPADSPAIAPLDSRTIAFACGDRICVWEHGAASPRMLAPTAASGFDSLPTWSPDGRRIAYVHTAAERIVKGGRHTIYVVDRDGSRRARVARRLGDSPLDIGFAWAPDGRHLAVSSTPPGQTGRRSLELYLVNLRGRRTRRLTRNSVFDGQPAWRGGRLLYLREPPVGRRAGRRDVRDEIRVLERGLAHDRRVALLPRWWGGSLIASPDGRRVALPGDRRAYVVDVRTGRLTVLAQSDGDLVGMAWAPDSRRVALLRGGSAIDILDLRGRRELHVPPDNRYCGDPDWSPDGRWLVCRVYYGEENPERRGTGDLLFTNMSNGARAVRTLSPHVRIFWASWAP